jgi:hypothetical protein
MRQLARLALPALVLLLCACAAKNNVDPTRHFLGPEFGKMTPVANAKERYSWRNPNFDPKHYSAVILDPTVVWQAEAMAQDAGVTREELDAVARHFDQVLLKAMQSIDFPVKSDAAPRTLRISAAITQVKASNPTMNTISSVLPVGILMTLGRKAAGGSDPNVGSCSIEMRFSDAVTGETLGLFADHKEGDKYDSANFHALGQAEKATDQWAEGMRTAILRIWGARPS